MKDGMSVFDHFIRPVEIKFGIKNENFDFKVLFNNYVQLKSNKILFETIDIFIANLLGELY